MRTFKAFVSAALLSSVAACASLPSADVDQTGINVYPPECSVDANYPPVLILPMPRAVMAEIAAVDALRGGTEMRDGVLMLARWDTTGGKNTIMVDNMVGGWRRADAIRHERCHALIAKLYPETNGKWHK